MAENLKLKNLTMPDGNSYVFNATYLNDLTLDEIKAAIKQEVQVETVQYLGLVSSASQLSATAGYGDFHRVSEGFTDPVSGKEVHAGDLLVAAKANPEQNLNETNWVMVHGEEGNLISHTHSITLPTINVQKHTHTFTGEEATLSFNPQGTVSVNANESGTANYTPKGDITLSGKTAAAEGTADVASTEHIHDVTASGSYTPEGTISGSFSAEVSNTEKPEEEGVDVASSDHIHTVTIKTGTGTANYTPAGSVSQPTFSGGKANADSNNIFTAAPGEHTHSVTYTPTGTITGEFSGGSMNSTGTAAATTATAFNAAKGDHTHEIEATNSEISYVSEGIKVKSYDSSSQTLTFEALTANKTSVTTAVTAAKATAASSRGDVAPYSHTHEVSVSGTSAGSIVNLKFTGTEATFNTGTNSGENKSVSLATHSHDVTGTVSKPTFTGIGVELLATAGAASATSKVASKDHTHKVTAGGEITGLTFTGKAATISVNGTAAKSTSAVTTVASSEHIHGVGTLAAVFAGKGVQLTGSFSGNSASIKYTPVGTISEENVTIAFDKQTVETEEPSDISTVYYSGEVEVM